MIYPGLWLSNRVNIPGVAIETPPRPDVNIPGGAIETSPRPDVNIPGGAIETPPLPDGRLLHLPSHL